MGISRQAKQQLKAVQDIFGNITEQTSSNNILLKTQTSLAEIQSNFATITSFFDKSTSLITTIAQQLGKVEHFADHIKTIGKTTDILALNAAIAAANAGSAGVGFKVIATEVKNLAKESTNSIGEIALITAALSTTIHHIKDELQAVQANAHHISERTNFLFAETTATLGATLTDAADKIQRIAQDAEGLSKEIGRAVVSIQFQDITRQRIEHVITPLQSLNQEVCDSLDKLTQGTVEAADSSASLSTTSLLGQYTMESERQILNSVTHRPSAAMQKEQKHG
jgi:methyl-accepting chemotaxis protein